MSEEEIRLDEPILSVDEAIAVFQGQIDSVSVQEEQLLFAKIGLEYLSVISSEGELLIVLVWRFWVGHDSSDSLIHQNAYPLAFCAQKGCCSRPQKT